MHRAGNKGTELGNSRASREINQPPKGVKTAPQYMLRLSQPLLRPGGLLTLGSG
jgi:hypothetical protein